MRLLFVLLALAGTLNWGRPNSLTVHEWGTFTSVAGEDGAAIDWDALGCKDDLPRFVYDFGYRGFKWRLTGTVRMETPVMYFYSAEPMDACVKVRFPQGLITEWYPKAEYEIYQKNRYDGLTYRLPANLNGIDTSLATLTGAIEWKNVKVHPDSAPTLPVESSPSRYYAARGTDAAPITAGDQNEKFLFYRGVGRPSIPLAARVSRDGRVEIENRGGDPIPSVILFENRQGQIGYRILGAIRGGATAGPPSLNGSLTALRTELEEILTAQGLFPKEAHAMIETWKDSWFESGSRLIYIVPPRAIASILPLQIDPPAQVERVFVGRMELITPEILRSAEEALAAGDSAALRQYGRFVQPILDRVSAAAPPLAKQAQRVRAGVQQTIAGGQCQAQ